MWGQARNNRRAECDQQLWGGKQYSLGLSRPTLLNIHPQKERTFHSEWKTQLVDLSVFRKLQCACKDKMTTGRSENPEAVRALRARKYPRNRTLDWRKAWNKHKSIRSETKWVKTKNSHINVEGHKTDIRKYQRGSSMERPYFLTLFTNKIPKKEYEP